MWPGLGRPEPSYGCSWHSTVTSRRITKILMNTASQIFGAYQDLSGYTGIDLSMPGLEAVQSRKSGYTRIRPGYLVQALKTSTIAENEQCEHYRQFWALSQILSTKWPLNSKYCSFIKFRCSLIFGVFSMHSFPPKFKLHLKFTQPWRHYARYKQYWY